MFKEIIKTKKMEKTFLNEFFYEEDENIIRIILKNYDYPEYVRYCKKNEVIHSLFETFNFLTYSTRIKLTEKKRIFESIARTFKNSNQMRCYLNYIKENKIITSQNLNKIFLQDAINQCLFYSIMFKNNYEYDKKSFDYALLFLTKHQIKL